MKPKVSKFNSTSRVKKKNSNQAVRLSNFPPEMLQQIVKNLKFNETIQLRSTCRLMKDIVDHERKIEFIRWKASVQPDRTFVVNRFTEKGFFPPILHWFINRNEALADTFHDNRALLQFYRQAQDNFDEISMKTLFLCTMFDMLSKLSDGVEKHRTWRTCLSLSYSIKNVFFGIIWSRGSRKNCRFPDFSDVLIILKRMIDIRETLSIDPTNRDVHIRNQVDLGDKIAIVGNRVNFNRPMSKRVPCVNLELHLKGEAELIEAFRSFRQNGSFDWEKARNFNLEARFKSRESVKGANQLQIFNIGLDRLTEISFSANCSGEYVIKF